MKRFVFNFKSILWLVLMIPILSFGQTTKTISGKVISSSDDSPLPGVNIMIKGTANGTVTNIDGEYSLEIPDGNTILVISYIGYLSEEVDVANRSVIDVSLVVDITGLDEVVVIGYGTSKKKELTGAVVQVKADELTQIASSDLGAAIQGRVSGVNVQASSGAPGARSNIQIRGINSINGQNSPLYVVDGIPYDDDPGLSNDEIESIDILKDAASAAIYGTRGSGGVILITTKQGKAGQMKVSLNSYYGIQKITSGIPLMNFDDYMYTGAVNSRNNMNTHDNGYWTQLETSKDDFTNNTDLVNSIQNDNAPISNHSLQVAGGKEDLTYSVVGSYFNQEGVLVNSGYERFNARANAMFLKNRWTIKTGLGFSIDEQEYEPWELLYTAYKYKPFQQELDPNMEFVENAGNPNSNEVNNISNIAAKLLREDVRNGEKFNGNIDVNFKILEGFNFVTRLGANMGNDTRVEINPLFIVYDNEGGIVPSNNRSSVQNRSMRSTGLTWETGLNYEKAFGKHKIKALGVFTMEKFTYSEFTAKKYDLVSNEVTVLNGATADPDASSGTNWSQDRVTSLVGMLGRLQYNYAERYFLSASVRRDGSSRFAEKNRWGTFPSVSARWNVADEYFWQPINHIANNFSIRASYGTTGNQNFQDYRYSPSIVLGKDYPFGPESSDKLGLGATQASYANPYVQWETSVQKNLGFDMGFLNNRLQFTAEFYNTEKQDMLYPLLLPPSTGGGKDANVILNVGDMTNRGMEYMLSYKQAGIFTWGVSGTFTINENEITKMSGTNKLLYFEDGNPINVPGNNDRVTVIAEGYEAGAFFVMETNGIVNTEEKLAEYQKLRPTAKMGDYIYVDQNGDGIFNEEDRVYAGSGAPEWETSVVFDCAYRGFDFMMQWYASIGNEVINGGKMYSYIYGTHQDLVYQWSEANPKAVIPANRGTSHYNFRSYADVWVEDASFVRLKNVIIGYTINKNVTKKAKIDKVRFYLAAQNPLTFTKYDGYDPEVGNDGLATRGLDKGNYPVSAQYRAGIQIDF